jgi:beta-glucosidase-like glycosyl hydrolase
MFLVIVGKRVSEGSGEDAYLGSQIAKAMVKGINKMICQK